MDYTDYFDFFKTIREIGFEIRVIRGCIGSEAGLKNAR